MITYTTEVYATESLRACYLVMSTVFVHKMLTVFRDHSIYASKFW